MFVEELLVPAKNHMSSRLRRQVSNLGRVTNKTISFKMTLCRDTQTTAHQDREKRDVPVSTHHTVFDPSGFSDVVKIDRIILFLNGEDPI